MRAAPPRRRRTAASPWPAGPGLASDGAEVPAVAPLYDDVTVLAGADATAEQVLRGLDGAWLAHIAAHGTFRADSPLFSSLRLYDGPLTVYDFEQLRRAPYRLVLSSCDAGAGPGRRRRAARPGQQPAAARHGRIVASVVPLNDEAAVPLMVDLHRHLHAGQTLAGALRTVRQGHGADPIEHSTALSLTALGADDPEPRVCNHQRADRLYL